MVKGKKIEYLIKWKNYDDPKDNTWEPADDMEVADELIQIFENLHDDIENKTGTTKSETKKTNNSSQKKKHNPKPDDTVKVIIETK